MARWDDEQYANARTIAAVGRQVGASQRDILIALMTAMQESGLHNIDYGDRDSIGLFQQRDAWGTHSQRMNPTESAVMFFTGGHDGQRGLLDFAERDRMSLTQAAQAVQVSAFPDAYAQHEDFARGLLGALGGEGGSGSSISLGPTSGPAAPGVTVPTPAPAGTPAPTTTINPPLDLTAATLAAQERAKAGVTPLGPASTPGVAASTAPGVEASVAPGVAASTAPGVMLAEPAPPEPEIPADLTLDQFRTMFPDAAATAMFTGAAAGTNNARRADLVAHAMSYIGTPYVWGGNDYDGVDCSGLTSQVYASFGIDLPRLSADQARAGTRTEVSQLAPGDLVATDNSARNNGADHIAVYAGDGWIIEAPRPGLAVRRRRLSESEMRAYWGVHFTQLD